MKAAVIVALAACGPIASSDDGLGDLLSIPGAQFRPGPMPAPSGGPPILSLQPDRPTAVIGTVRESVTGVLDPTATAAIIGLGGVPGASGTWIVTAGPPAIDTPDDASLNLSYALDPAFPPGPFELEVAAVDDAGRIGAITTASVLALPDAPPTGDLVVSLSWPGTADLDIHVVDPTGAEVWYGNPNSYKAPPNTPPDPCMYLSGGMLDHDANAECERDSTPSEDVIWVTRTCRAVVPSMPIPPDIAPGTYTVRVEAKSLCSDASSPWLVTAFSEGVSVGAARGIATPDDAEYGKHGPGAGVTALTFNIP